MPSLAISEIEIDDLKRVDFYKVKRPLPLRFSECSMRALLPGLARGYFWIFTASIALSESSLKKMKNKDKLRYIVSELTSERSTPVHYGKYSVRNYGLNAWRWHQRNYHLKRAYQKVPRRQSTGTNPGNPLVKHFFSFHVRIGNFPTTEGIWSLLFRRTKSQLSAKGRSILRPTPDLELNIIIDVLVYSPVPYLSEPSTKPQSPSEPQSISAGVVPWTTSVYRKASQ